MPTADSASSEVKKIPQISSEIINSRVWLTVLAHSNKKIILLITRLLISSLIAQYYLFQFQKKSMHGFTAFTMFNLAAMTLFITFVGKKVVIFASSTEETAKNKLEQELDSRFEKINATSNITKEVNNLLLEFRNEFLYTKNFTSSFEKLGALSALVLHYFNLAIFSLCFFIFFNEVSFIKKAEDTSGFLVESFPFLFSLTIFGFTLTNSYKNILPYKLQTFRWEKNINVQHMQIFFANFHFMKADEDKKALYVEGYRGYRVLSYKFSTYSLFLYGNRVEVSTHFLMRLVRSYVQDKYKDLVCYVDDFNYMLKFLTCKDESKLTHADVVAINNRIINYAEYELIATQLNEVSEKFFGLEKCSWIKAGHVGQKFYLNLVIPEQVSEEKFLNFLNFFKKNGIRVESNIIRIGDEEEQQQIINVFMEEPWAANTLAGKLSSIQQKKSTQNNSTIYSGLADGQRLPRNPAYINSKENIASSHYIGTSIMDGRNQEKISFTLGGDLRLTVDPNMKINNVIEVNSSVWIIKLNYNLYAILDDREKFFSTQELKDARNAFENGIQQGKCKQGIVWDRTTRTYKIKMLGRIEGDMRIPGSFVNVSDSTACLIRFSSTDCITNYHTLAKRHNLTAS